MSTSKKAYSEMFFDVQSTFSIGKNNTNEFVDATDACSTLLGTSTTPHNQQLRPLRVYIVSWNVGTRFPDNISLRRLLQLHTLNGDSTEDNQLPDLYVVGLQEVNVQPQNQVLSLFKEDPWTNKVKDLLRNHDYVIIKTEQMQGLLLTLLFKREHVPHLRDIEAEFTRTGFGGIWGNKGAVSVRFNIYGCAITFVVAHLAAHDRHLEERIEDYNQILEHHHYHVKRYREIFEHDYVFWFGDLNFRLHGEDGPEEVMAEVRKQKLPELMQRDQLTYVREKTREAFQHMQEGVPEFPPTFKFKAGSSMYDLKRRPAWTDRILYAVQPLHVQPKVPLAIKQISYKSHPEYNISDHKPVTSEFEIEVFKNYLATAIKFVDIPIWSIGEEITVEYSKPLDFEEKDHDWIGIYPSNYASLTDYIGYEYVNQAESPPTDDSNDYQPMPVHHHRHHNRQRLRRQMQQNCETVRIDFSEDMDLKPGHNYVLIYFQNTGLRGVTSISGMSNEFRAEKKLSAPRAD